MANDPTFEKKMSNNLLLMPQTREVTHFSFLFSSFPTRFPSSLAKFCNSSTISSSSLQPYKSNQRCVTSSDQQCAKEQKRGRASPHPIAPTNAATKTIARKKKKVRAKARVGARARGR